MNAPQHEIAKRREEAERVGRLALELKQSEFAVTQAVIAEVEKLMGVTYLTISSNALCDPDNAVKVTFEMTLHLAPGSQRVSSQVLIAGPTRRVSGERAI